MFNYAFIWTVNRCTVFMCSLEYIQLILIENFQISVIDKTQIFARQTIRLRLNAFAAYPRRSVRKNENLR